MTEDPLLILLQAPGIIGSGSTALLFSPLGGMGLGRNWWESFL